MLKVMREKSKIFLWVVAVSFIGFMVAVWGMDLRQSDQQSSMTTIGEINGRKIGITEYQEAIRQVSENYRQQNKDREPTDEMRRDFADQAWQTIVERSVLDGEVKRRRIRVTDPEVVQYIRSNPDPSFFSNENLKTNGQFDFDKYRQVLNDPRFDWTPLEAYVRNLLPYEKLRQEVAATVNVTDDEVRERFLAGEEKIKASYLMLSARDFRDTTRSVADGDIEAYYKAHVEELKRPDQAVLSFVLFEKKVSEADDEEARTRAQEALAEARKGSDFAELARAYSEDDESATEGGDLGFFARGVMLPEFEQVAFALEPGQISEPVKTTEGYHVVKLEEKRTSPTGAGEVHARHILIKVEPSSETIAGILERANTFIDRAREETFDKAAQEQGLSPSQSSPFSKGDFVPGVGMLKRANSFAFSQEKGQVSGVIEGPRGYYVFSVSDRIGARVPPLEELKDPIREQVRADQQRAAAKARADAVLAAIRGGRTLEDAGKEFGLDKHETPLVTRVTTIAGIGRDTPFTHAAFALQPGQTSGVVELPSACYILRVDERQPADETRLAPQKEQIRRALYTEKLTARFTEFVQNLVATAEIKDRRSAQEES